MRRTAEDAEATRQSILAAAKETFVVDGYAEASTTAIADRAGVTRGALYHHFPTKQALFRAVFVGVEEDLNRTVLKEARGAGDPLGAFVAGCAAYLDFAVRPDYRRIAIIDGPAVLGQAEWHAIDADIGLAGMSAGLTALEAAGLLARPASPALAILLFGALTDAGLALARGDGPGREELLDAFVALVIG